MSEIPRDKLWFLKKFIQVDNKSCVHPCVVWNEQDHNFTAVLPAWITLGPGCQAKFLLHRRGRCHNRLATMQGVGKTGFYSWFWHLATRCHWVLLSYLGLAYATHVIPECSSPWGSDFGYSIWIQLHGKQKPHRCCLLLQQQCRSCAFCPDMKGTRSELLWITGVIHSSPPQIPFDISWCFMIKKNQWKGNTRLPFPGLLSQES